MRYSKQREIIYGILKDTGSHPTANWIYEAAREQIANISLGTVYRNLDQLALEGMIRVINVDNLARYDWNVVPHQHLRCSVCGKMSDIEIPDRQLIKLIKQSHQFDVEKIEMTFSGNCSEHN
ncbi:MAG: transcriptional repressor [Candidatus Marinimicrobia bacterium]|nr:transcriptional repressor [Candidatus Neomarinimicrobiota bacterium]